ncbi:unnamed protein product [Microthlaspi erraticum]|uniref:Uncharacterized protein n=1 Tax=Microthlaspi erraticum TaxID=1685480 RepID=A0A6D2K5T6_9BRAS|nr:unnamed protein product [Microthlaspi erraticum]
MVWRRRSNLDRKEFIDSSTTQSFDNLRRFPELRYREPITAAAATDTLQSEETARVLDQVIDTLNLSLVHLVLHDSALGLASNWVSENPQIVGSVTLVDSSISPPLPLWVLHIPLIREVLLGFAFWFGKLVSLRCSKEMVLLEIEAHMILLKGRSGREAVVGTLKKLIHSFF